jgi:hypothetical protein
MKNLTVRSIVTILMITFVFLAIRDYKKTKKRNSSNDLPIEVAYDNNEVVTNQSETIDVVSEDNEKTFYITGLDDVSQSDLEYTKEIIESFYGYHCVINESITTPNEACSDGTINAFSCVNMLGNSKKTLYLTNKLLVDDGVDLRGFTTINGETIIVRANRGFMKGTIIHEIGHTLGLEHCSDLTCVMATQNDEYDSGDFCENCKRIINR